MKTIILTLGFVLVIATILYTIVYGVLGLALPLFVLGLMLGFYLIFKNETTPRQRGGKGWLRGLVLAVLISAICILATYWDAIIHGVIK